MKRMKLNRRGVLALILASLLVVIIVLGIIFGVRSCSNGKVDGVANDSLDSMAVDTVVDLTSAEVVPFEGDVEVGNGAYDYLEELILGNSANMLYGLPTTDFDLEMNEIANGETFSKLMNDRYGVNIAVVNKLIDKSKGVFDMRDLRVGNPYTAFLSQDTSTTSGKLEYLVYERSRSEYIIFGVGGDSCFVKKEKKNVITEERYAEGVINSSLYATMYENDLNPMLANRLDAIYKWVIDFYTLQKGDSFRVLYEEQFIDTTSIGIGKIYGAEFLHNGKPYMAVRFEQGDEIGYWDASGKNLRRNFLASPLSFSARVSSKFGMRVHPIKRVRRQHNGVDYAAPKGTPVRAVADGTVTRRYFERGGGNTIWVRHAQGLESGYLHLSRFANGISVGTRVRQEQVIGYVGSTGMSTGPHLDFRIKQQGKYIDPLKTPSTPTNPIAAANKGAFNKMLADVQSVMQEYKKK